jgi:predicted RNA binding protein YcfA (HicA-like mRNA interferase family)
MMSKSQKILTDILSGRCDANIGFVDLCYILERAGFTRRPGKGSHTIFHMDQVAEIVNIQPLGSKAKAYQVKQVRDLILKYQLDIS